jgi:hypothetical protein
MLIRLLCKTHQTDGATVSIVAFQAVDPSSIPGWRTVFSFFPREYSPVALQPNQLSQVGSAECLGVFTELFEFG